jgi:hypothetical protein
LLLAGGFFTARRVALVGFVSKIEFDRRDKATLWCSRRTGGQFIGSGQKGA